VTPRRLLLASAVLLACGHGDEAAPAGEQQPPVRAAASAEEAAGEPGLGARLVERGRKVAAQAPNLEFSETFGGRPVTHAPEPGRYATALTARQHRFLTMEITLTHSIAGGASLELDDDGGLAGCVWAQTHDASSVGKYASRDGKPSHRDDKNDYRLGLGGTWALDETGHAAVLTVTKLDDRDCVLGPDARALPDPFVLHCYGLDPSPVIPVATLACRLDSDWPSAERVALLLAETPRAGAWALREDIAGRSTFELPDGTRPWLLLGASPGLTIRHDDDRARDPMRLGFSAAPVVTPVGPLL
jgi:hypothetical protein